MPSDASGAAGGERRTQGFAPGDRLRKRFEYRRLRDQGRRVHTSSFVFLIAHGAHRQARLGITVSRHVGGAVRRNRLKRLVREAFRQRRTLFPEAADVVVIAKQGCRIDSLQEVEHEFTRASAALHTAWRKGSSARSGEPS